MFRDARRLKTIFTIGLLAYVVFWILGCVQKETKNVDSRGQNIICFGDSLTYGYGVNSGEDYPTALSKMVRIPVLNMGIDGDSTEEALKRLNTDVLDRNPLLVIIEFSGNDFLRKVPMETTLNNVKEMVRQAHAKGTMVAIVDISAGLFMKDYNTALQSLAKEENAIFVPGVLSGIITNPSLKSDFLHPNANGYKIIAQRVYRAIYPSLNKNALSKDLKD